MAGYSTLGNPNIPSAAPFTGYMGFRDALDAYMNQVAGPEQNAEGDLAASAAADQVGGAFQADTGLEGGYSARRAAK